ncbi:hypothetical protein BDB01DRAFT_837919 [Pilobolus umbonatus]|nr:hypothetical protein BDB01DRAFT_837919 [Pilobolus umbonatus]
MDDQDSLVLEWTTAIEALDYDSIQGLLDINPDLIWTPLSPMSHLESDFSHFITQLKKFKKLGDSIRPLYALHHIMFDYGVSGDEWATERSELVDFFIKNSTAEDLNACYWGSANNTVLHLAYFIKQDELIMKLIEMGASPDIQNTLGHTPDVHSNYEKSDTVDKKHPHQDGKKPTTKKMEIYKDSDRFKKLRALAESPNTMNKPVSSERQNSTRRYFRPGHLEEKKRQVFNDEEEAELEKHKQKRQKDVELLNQRSAVKNNPLFKKFEGMADKKEVPDKGPIRTGAVTLNKEKVAEDPIKRSSRVINSLKDRSVVSTSVFRQQAEPTGEKLSVPTLAQLRAASPSHEITVIESDDEEDLEDSVDANTPFLVSNTQSAPVSETLSSDLPTNQIPAQSTTATETVSDTVILSEPIQEEVAFTVKAKTDDAEITNPVKKEITKPVIRDIKKPEVTKKTVEIETSRVKNIIDNHERLKEEEEIEIQMVGKKFTVWKQENEGAIPLITLNIIYSNLSLFFYTDDSVQNKNASADVTKNTSADVTKNTSADVTKNTSADVTHTSVNKIDEDRSSYNIPNKDNPSLETNKLDFPLCDTTLDIKLNTPAQPIDPIMKKVVAKPPVPVQHINTKIDMFESQGSDNHSTDIQLKPTNKRLPETTEVISRHLDRLESDASTPTIHDKQTKAIASETMSKTIGLFESYLPSLDSSEDKPASTSHEKSDSGVSLSSDIKNEKMYGNITSTEDKQVDSLSVSSVKSEVNKVEIINIAPAISASMKVMDDSLVLESSIAPSKVDTFKVDHSVHERNLPHKVTSPVSTSPGNHNTSLLKQRGLHIDTVDLTIGSPVRSYPDNLLNDVIVEESEDDEAQTPTMANPYSHDQPNRNSEWKHAYNDLLSNSSGIEFDDDVDEDRQFIDTNRHSGRFSISSDMDETATLQALSSQNTARMDKVMVETENTTDQKMVIFTEIETNKAILQLSQNADDEDKEELEEERKRQMEQDEMNRMSLASKASRNNMDFYSIADSSEAGSDQWYDPDDNWTEQDHSRTQSARESTATYNQPVEERDSYDDMDFYANSYNIPQEDNQYTARQNGYHSPDDSDSSSHTNSESFSYKVSHSTDNTNVDEDFYYDHSNTDGYYEEKSELKTAERIRTKEEEGEIVVFMRSQSSEQSSAHPLPSAPALTSRAMEHSTAKVTSPITMRNMEHSTAHVTMNNTNVTSPITMHSMEHSTVNTIPSKTHKEPTTTVVHTLERGAGSPRIDDLSQYMKSMPDTDSRVVEQVGERAVGDKERGIPHAHEINFDMISASQYEEKVSISTTEAHKFGKMYIFVSGAHNMLLPLPREITYVRCVISDGNYEYTSRYEILGHQILMDYECIINTTPGMIVTVSLHVRPDYHVKPRTGWSKLFTSIRKQKEHLSGYVHPEDGAIGQTRFAVDHMIPGCYKKTYEANFDCFNSWYARTNKERQRREQYGDDEDFLKIVGKLTVEMLYLPVSQPSVSVPKSLRECDLALKIRQWHETCWQSGYLSIRCQGFKLWERHFYRLVGSQLIGYESNRIFEHYNISDVITLSAASDKVIVTLAEQDPNEKVFKAESISEENERGFFRLKFADYYLDCVSDDAEESEEWVKMLKSMIGRIPLRLQFGE